MTADDKLDALRRIIRGSERLAIAFSGGVDSTFLAAVAHAELGDDALAVTAMSPLHPARDQAAARELAAQIGIRHLVVESDELAVPGFAANPPNRCYLCKNALFQQLHDAVEPHGFSTLADGTNADDADDYRPGRRALLELGVLSPLAEAGMGKAEIRELSRRLGLSTADKPAFACLASRIPYGAAITPEKLRAVDAVEEALRAAGFRQYRVRHHGEIARIEVDPSELPRLSDPAMRERIAAAAHAAGFRYVAADLDGYRTGSLNESL